MLKVTDCPTNRTAFPGGFTTTTGTTTSIAGALVMAPNTFVTVST